MSSEVYLEEINSTHAHALFQLLNDDDVYLFLDNAPPQSVDDTHAWINRVLAGGTPSGDEVWMNWCVFSGATMLGYVQSTYYPQPNTADIAYVFGKDHWGKGFATRATQLMVDQLVEGFNPKILHATLEANNQRSISLLVRLGFHEASRIGTEVTFQKYL